MTTPKEIVEFAKQNDVEMVDLKFIDFLGTWQHFTVPVSELNEEMLDEGRMFDGSSIRCWQTIDNSDMKVVPDLDTVKMDPFYEVATMSIICDIKDPVTGEGYTRDPRSVTKKAENYLVSTGIGDTIFVGPEAEFFMFDDVRYAQGPEGGFYSIDSPECPWNTGVEEVGGNKAYKIGHKSGYFPAAPFDQDRDIRAEMVLAMQELGLTIEAQHHEVAPAQQESSIVGEQEQQTPAPTMSNEQAGPLSINSPVASVLATRNMLRSRKKELEKQTKKPRDAALRQPNKDESSDNSVNTTAESKVPVAESLVLAPEPKEAFHQDNIDPATITKANQVDKWAHMIDTMQLTARIRQLAIHATISEDSTDDNLILKLDKATRHLSTEIAHQQLQSSICEFLSRPITVTLDIVEETVADPYQIQGQINDKRLVYAKSLIKEDAVVIALQDTFQANLNEDSISPR